jgi:hypothetical protein
MTYTGRTETREYGYKKLSPFNILFNTTNKREAHNSDPSLNPGTYYISLEHFLFEMQTEEKY